TSWRAPHTAYVTSARKAYNHFEMSEAAPSSGPADGLDNYHRVIRLSECRVNEGTFVEMAGRELAVFRMMNPPAVYVLDNACPHANGNLAAGRVKDGIVRCPWHGWR